jgi:hypothetical protein
MVVPVLRPLLDRPSGVSLVVTSGFYQVHLFKRR